MKLRKFNKVVICVCSVVVSSWIVYSHASDVFLEATRPDFQKIPIWVLDFGNVKRSEQPSPNGNREVVNLLKADLTRSQVFSVLDRPVRQVAFSKNKCLRPTQVSEAASEGTTVSTWGRIGLGRLNKGELGLIFDACAFDTGNKDFLFGKRYYSRKAGEALLRLMAHRWADELVYRYTGEQGIARTKIAYVSEAGPGRELFVMDYDGYGPQQVTADGFLNLMPAWSSDRKFLVYTAYRHRKQLIVKRELATGMEETLVSPMSLNITPAFSPDGRYLAYASAQKGNSDIFKLDLQTREVTQLTTHRSADLSPTWAPDGQALAFTSDRGGRPQVYIMNGDGSNVRRLTYEGDYNAAPTWSPKGDWIAYVCRIPSEGFKLCRITPDSQRLVKLTSGQSIDDSPSWSPEWAASGVQFKPSRKKPHIFN